METERCILREVSLSDLEDIKRMYGNERVRAYLGGVAPGEVIEEQIRGMAPGEDHQWVARNKTTGAFIGMVSLDTHHDGEGIEVSYQTLPEWWGKGYGTELVRQVVGYAFDTLHLPVVLAETQSRNHSSVRLLEKVGFTFQGNVVRFGAEQSIYKCESI